MSARVVRQSPGDCEQASGQPRERQLHRLVHFSRFHNVVLDALRKEGDPVDPKVEEYAYVRYGWIMDPTASASNSGSLCQGQRSTSLTENSL